MQKKTTKPPAKTAKKKKSPVKKQDQKFSFKRLIMGEEKPDLTELEAAPPLWTPAGWPPWWRLGRAPTSVLSSSANRKKNSVQDRPDHHGQRLPDAGRGFAAKSKASY